MSYDNTNTGALFKNRDKQPDDKRPDYTGEVDVDGKKFRLAAWLKTSKKGEKYMSLKFTEPRHMAEQVKQEAGLDDDGLPF